MELKCDITSQAGEFVLVLIVPLWNLNVIAIRGKACKACSNRTFMELKLAKVFCKVAERAVLIVPLWN